MESVINQLNKRFREAIVSAYGPTFENTDPLIRPTQEKRFGDYQSNVCMGLAKQLKQPPRKIAETILSHLKIEDIASTVEIAGAGFINIRLDVNWLEELINQIKAEEHCGVEKVRKPQRIIVDYSGPNIAKQMHVGHLRSTIIGDVIARLLEFLGHEVIRQNHIGDWGTQFGMLIAYLIEKFGPNADKGNFHIDDIEEFYKEANKRFEEDNNFVELSRSWVVKLQSGDPKAINLWKKFRDESLRSCEEIYKRLNIKLTREDIRGESFYNDMLPQIVQELVDRKIAVEDKGAICVFFDEFKGKDGSTTPLIIRKSDGGYLYATTDLAAIKFRVQILKAHRIIYVTDARQSLHFQQVFATARKAGWDIHPETKEPVKLEHITFGTVLGENGRPLKTRSGENVKLKDLLDEAVKKARAIVETKNPDLPEEKKAKIAEVVGISAIKYADLSQNRTSDYIFSFDKMLAMDGNTAPYLLYAYARIRSILRKAGKEADPDKLKSSDTKIILKDPVEIELAKKLIQFQDLILDVADNLRLNLITNYLYELAQTFSIFYENCPVIKAEDTTIQKSRLALSMIVADTLKEGLEILGIERLEQM